MDGILRYKHQKSLFLISLFFIFIPPVYFITPLLSIHFVAKAIWFILFVILLVDIFFLKNPAYKGGLTFVNNRLAKLFGLFFISQSLSVITAHNIEAFMMQYEDLFFAALFIVAATNIIRKGNHVRSCFNILFAGAVVNILFQFVIYLFPDLWNEVGTRFLPSGYMELISLNTERGRIYFESYDEVVIPIIFYFMVLGKSVKKNIIILFLITYVSFISNFRTRFLMLAVAYAGSFVLLSGIFLKYKKIIVLLPIVLYLFYFITQVRSGFTVFDRLLLLDTREDVMTITGRLYRWKNAADIGYTSSIFGVGLGNYFDYLDPSLKLPQTVSRQALKEYELAAYDPHNIFIKIFAETGIVGLTVFCLVIASFLGRDLRKIRTQKELQNAVIISFWTLFLYSLFNPVTTTKYLVLFWLFRIIIDKTDNLVVRPVIK